MLEWIKRKAAVNFLINDTQKTLDTVCSLPTTTQRMIAQSTMSTISTASSRLKTATVASADEVLAKLLNETKSNRHLSLALGATSHSNPTWAAAALTESWLMAFSPKFPRKGFEQINTMITAWARSVLTAVEMEKY